jgi:cation diffusion facilitator family transporter
MEQQLTAQKDSNHNSKHIIQSLIVNLLIVLAKAFAAFMTRSGAMLAETIHSFADCANQALLLRGVNQAKRPADEKHPFGYGMAVYFSSFMVAMLLFSIGGMFSIYEGIHKYHSLEPVKEIGWGVGILSFSILLEGYAAYSNIVEINKRRGNRGFINYLRFTKDSDLIVIFGENAAAVLGLVLALGAMLASYYTGDGRYDAMGSLAIGVVLILVAIFLAIEVKSLLIGESADPIITDVIEELVAKNPNINALINCRTIQQGPGEVLVCMKIKCDATLNSEGISILINNFEKNLRVLRPDVKWLYIEPDFQEWKTI